MMNTYSKAGSFIPQTNNYFQLRSALFHSTPVLERKRRNFWDSRPNGYSRRQRKQYGKQSLLRNVGAFTEDFFQNSRNDSDEDDPSWFRKQYSKGSRQNRTRNQGARYSSKKNFEFIEEEINIESIFRSAFGGNRFFYWSFINEENPQWRRSSGYSNYFTRNRGQQYQYDYDSSPESDDADSDLTSDRLALGLKAYGPLKIEDVKIAYRTCALKWHPDRHQGSSKAVAEEKFKRCSAAYHSLCDKLTPS